MDELNDLVGGMDQAAILENLKTLIDQTYVIEQEYASLRKTFDDVIETQANALWILDNEGSIYLQNSKAENRHELFNTLHFDEKEYEQSFGDRSYLIKNSSAPDGKHIVSATDITEQKRKESLATMGQMAAHLSHEIRNPIGSISLLTSTLLKRVKLENKPIVLEIQKAIFRIERIIKATLMFSKGIEANKELINFVDLALELENAIGYYSFSKDIDFKFNFPDVAFLADFELLLMVFSNLVFNAIDAIEEHEHDEGEVVISHSEDAKYYHFSITDTGVPFSDVIKLFEAFESSKEKGNGLGLVLSKEIIDCHNGKISIINDNAKGFKISLEKVSR